MTLFVISVAIVLLVSAFSSMSESAIYAVRMTYVMTLSNSGSLAGKVLREFKENMERPISAILILNTAANTAGAAIAGHQAQQLFGESAVGWFAAVFTVAVLVFSEIIPKLVGVVYCRSVAPGVALIWAALIWLLSPVIWLIEKLTKLIQPEEPRHVGAGGGGRAVGDDQRRGGQHLAARSAARAKCVAARRCEGGATF